jgi:hypothetical protein
MGHRRKQPPPPAESVDWSQYGPDTPQYWTYGGPWIHPDDIPPQEQNPEYLGSAMKLGARRTYLREIIKSSDGDIDRQTKRYLLLHENGMEALEPWSVERWQRAVHACSVKPDEPDPVSQHLAFCYRDIRYSRGRIKAAERALDGMDRESNPLLHWND